KELIAKPDRASEDLAYLDGRKLSALNVEMDVYQIENRPREELPTKQGSRQDLLRDVEEPNTEEIIERRVSWKSVREGMEQQPGSIVVLTGRAGEGKTQLTRMTMSEIANEGFQQLQAGQVDLESLPLPVGLTCAALA